MGQNKLENQIKEKLNSREIQPSAQAWDRLDAMLTVAEEKKTKRSFGWLYIAASVAVLLTAGLFLFNQKNTGIDTQNGVVGTETKKDTVQKNQIQAPIINNEAVATSENQPSTNNQQPTTKINQSVSIKAQGANGQINQNQTNKNQQSIAQGQNNQNLLINRDQPIEFQNSSDVAQRNNPKIMNNEKPVVFPNIKNQVGTLTDEQLLAGLDNSAKQQSGKTPNVKVNAKSLLTQVDGELDMTFREKVISKVAKNYKEVKVALANRNNE